MRTLVALAVIGIMTVASIASAAPSDRCEPWPACRDDNAPPPIGPPMVVDANGQVVGMVIDQYAPYDETPSPGPTMLFEAVVLVQINGIPCCGSRYARGHHRLSCP